MQDSDPRRPSLDTPALTEETFWMGGVKPLRTKKKKSTCLDERQVDPSDPQSIAMTRMTRSTPEQGPGTSLWGHDDFFSWF